MLAFTFRFAQRAFSRLLDRALGSGPVRRLRSQALLAGAVLGTLVHALAAAAQRDGEPRFRLAMALVVVIAGGLSFVLYAQQAQPRQAARRPAQRQADVQAVASWMGCGLVAALEALPRVAG